MAQRKVVTALFVDVVGSTSLAESHDPETLRNVLDRYFAEARTVVERHGGSVEKFIGDAVVALFGVPVAHEDDALRALRAAEELRIGLARLNESFERVGIHIDVRTGVNTGEVVVDDARVDGFRASGDTMNVAARLQQSAAPGEILVGALTRELGGQAIEVGAVEPLEVKGKSRPLEAHRLLRVLDDVDSHGRDGSAPLVGRGEELETLAEALRDARARRRCVARTLVGPPGVGKSRIAREFLSAKTDGARVLVGRCPSYGEGVTFLPLAEALEPILAADSPEAVDDRERVEVALGLREGSISPDEAFSSVRAVLEALAHGAPIVLVVDDLHWAEPLLLDFLEHLVSFSSDGAMLVVCLARPELLDVRPSWGEPRENARLVVVAPLGDVDSAELVRHLLRSRGLEAEELERILDAADGNPLFLEQLLALNAAVGPDDPLAVPATISALLAARLDQLRDDERRILDAAAVEGRVFHREHVERLLAGESPDVAQLLVGLEHRQFVRPAREEGALRETFAFAHGLVRDAAYAAVSKDRRAQLHLELADVLAEDPDALDEIVGLHLADAARLRIELGHADDDTRSLAVRAARRLLAGGERALGMGDDRAAAKLLERVVDLVGTDEPEGRLARLQLGRALAGSARLDSARTVLSESVDAARSAGERALELRGVLALANLRSQTDVTVSMAELRRSAEETLPELEELGDEPGLALAWWLLHWTQFRQGQYRRSIEAAEQAVVHAVRANERREQLRALGAMAIAARSGDLPVAEALEKCDEVVDRADGARYVDAFAARVRGHLLAMRGEFERGRQECMRAVDILEELGLPISALGVSAERALVEKLAGDLGAAERELRKASERFREIGDLAYLSWIDPTLAYVLAEQGEASEALDIAQAARRQMQPDHAFGQIVSRVAEGMALCSLGRLPEARELALEAVQIAEPTDAIDIEALALLLLADLDVQEGALDRAAERRLRALANFEVKGDLVSATRVRELL